MANIWIDKKTICFSNFLISIFLQIDLTLLVFGARQKLSFDFGLVTLRSSKMTLVSKKSIKASYGSTTRATITEVCTYLFESLLLLNLQWRSTIPVNIAHPELPSAYLAFGLSHVTHVLRVIWQYIIQNTRRYAPPYSVRSSEKRKSFFLRSSITQMELCHLWNRLDIRTLLPFVVNAVNIAAGPYDF